MSAAPGLVLLDTSVLIHIIRESALGKHILRQEQLQDRGERPMISAVTVGELLAFARKRGWGRPKLERLEELANELVVVDIGSRALLERYAEIDCFCEEQGKALNKNDLWIAATASVTGAGLITNDRDFDPLHEQFLRRVYYEPQGTYRSP